MTKPVAFFGYGRFGRALGDRFLDAGLRVRAFDPRAAVPGDLAAPSIPALLDGAGPVVLAVPVGRTEAALRELRPLLRPDHFVMDVGSVKGGPFAVLERLLGAEVPWLATHPLFGPTSLALGERPLSMVVCPSALHPGGAARAAALFHCIGCDLVEVDPETHDRTMARTHALAYFVAKGFLDSDLSLDTPFAPPSVRSLARTVQAAREDAGHLFASLHRENPYAAEARRRLLDALHAADAALRAPPPPGEEAHREATEVRIAEPESVPPQLREAREIIDEIDGDLLRLLARRAEVSLHAARAKARSGRGVRDPGREASLLGERRGLARRLGLDEAAVTEIFEAVLRFSRGHQRDHGG